jgi:hypothetical protein
MKTIEQIVAELSQKLPESLIKTLPAKGLPRYISHQEAKAIGNRVAPNWCWEIKDQGVLEVDVEEKDKNGIGNGKFNKVTKFWVLGRLTIPTENGPIYREAYGHEDSGDPNNIYGDPFSNAEAMSHKRCWAWFGLGLHDLYMATMPRPVFGTPAIVKQSPIDSGHPDEEYKENATSMDSEHPEPEEDEHPWYATSASLSDKLKESILRLAEGDLDRAVEVLELHMIRKEAGLDPIWTQTIAVASLDHATELELPQAMVKLAEVIGDDLASAFDYYVLCLRAGYTIDLANANLARCGNDIAAAMTAAQRDNGKAA